MKFAIVSAAIAAFTTAAQAGVMAARQSSFQFECNGQLNPNVRWDFVPTFPTERVLTMSRPVLVLSSATVSRLVPWSSKSRAGTLKTPHGSPWAIAVTVEWRFSGTTANSSCPGNSCTRESAPYPPPASPTVREALPSMPGAAIQSPSVTIRPTTRLLSGLSRSAVGGERALTGYVCKRRSQGVSNTLTKTKGHLVLVRHPHRIQQAWLDETLCRTRPTRWLHLGMECSPDGDRQHHVQHDRLQRDREAAQRIVGDGDFVVEIEHEWRSNDHQHQVPGVRVPFSPPRMGFVLLRARFLAMKSARCTSRPTPKPGRACCFRVVSR